MEDSALSDEGIKERLLRPRLASVVFGVPLHADDPSADSMFHRLDDTVRCPCGDDQIRRDILQSLVMERVRAIG